MHWLQEQIRQAASAVEDAGGTIRAFRRAIDERFVEAPITDWETRLWTRGLKRGLLQLNSHWFRAGSGRQTAFSFFVRNEAGLLVGLRRESITQAAVYVALVTHYGYPRSRVRFEMDYLDVALRDAAGEVTLYAETKASDRVLDRLAASLSSDFAGGLPALNLPEGKLTPDPHQKAAHILRARPQHFWAVSPGRRLAYAVEYTERGFVLSPRADIPFQRDVDLFSMAEAVPAA